jgi:hypothetical protein
MTTPLIKNLASCYPRDRWAIDMLTEHRVLTPNQLSALGFADDPTHATYRLRVLGRRGWLDRFRLGRDTAWYLGPLGVKLATLANRRRPKAPELRLIEANQFFVDLAAYARTQRHTDLRHWRSTGYGEYLRDGKRIGFWFQPSSPVSPGTLLIRAADASEEAQVRSRLRGTGHAVATTYARLGHPADAVWLQLDGDSRIPLHDLPEAEPLHERFERHPIFDPNRPTDEAIADGEYSYA